MSRLAENLKRLREEQEQLNEGVDLGNLTPGQTLRIQYRAKN